jgi:hypothetical protein
MLHKSGGPGGPNTDATKVAKIMLLIRAKVKKSKVHGVGLFAAQFVSKGTKTWKLKPKIDLVIKTSEYKKYQRLFARTLTIISTNASLQKNGYSVPTTLGL